MSDLIAITYPDRNRAEEVRTLLSQLQADHRLAMEDICFVTKDEAGEIKLHQYPLEISPASAEHAGAAVNNGFWGMMVGTLFLNPVLGGMIGASTGTLADSAGSVTIFDNTNHDFLRNLPAQMQIDSSAIFIWIADAASEPLLTALSDFGGTLLRTSLPKNKAALLQATLGAT
ncbi:DUF1269 domain-containing protein [Armatimonas sp.]|uniref:DUF1269 domain-containing protein n=1 Tax=Armatimonas sp. TaxID=1872638 RepID=UPI0037506F1B